MAAPELGHTVSQDGHGNGKVAILENVETAETKVAQRISSKESRSREEEAMKAYKPLEGFVGIVTGSATEDGIGAAIALELAQAGAKAVINGHPEKDKERIKKTQQMLSAKGVSCKAILADVSNPDDAERLVRETVEEFGRVDIVVNCAGITQDRTLKKMSHAEWDAVIATNLNSAFNVTHHAVQEMLKQNEGLEPDEKYGRIINISSVVGEEGNFGQTNYAAAKAGMIAFIQSAALELGKEGITANAVCPGFIRTGMTARMPEDDKKRVEARIPEGHMGEPEDIAQAVLFLALPGKQYINGAHLDVNGGLARK